MFCSLDPQRRQSNVSSTLHGVLLPDEEINTELSRKPEGGHTPPPVLFNTCEVDPQFPIESQKIADELLGDGKYSPGYKRTYWDGCTHGFAVRGDIVSLQTKKFY